MPPPGDGCQRVHHPGRRVCVLEGTCVGSLCAWWTCGMPLTHIHPVQWLELQGLITIQWANVKAFAAKQMKVLDVNHDGTLDAKDAVRFYCAPEPPPNTELLSLHRRWPCPASKASWPPPCPPAPASRLASPWACAEVGKSGCHTTRAAAVNTQSGPPWVGVCGCYTAAVSQCSLSASRTQVLSPVRCSHSLFWVRFFSCTSGS